MNSDLNKQINSVVTQLQRQYTDLTPILSIISALINRAILKNFDAKGRWDGDAANISLFSGGSKKWIDLSDNTKPAYKRKGYLLEPTLIRTGHLRSTIEVRPKGKTSIVISANSSYAAIHQFGGVIKRTINKKDGGSSTTLITIPARPYLTLTDEDLEGIKDILYNFLK